MLLRTFSPAATAAAGALDVREKWAKKVADSAQCYRAYLCKKLRYSLRNLSV